MKENNNQSFDRFYHELEPYKQKVIRSIMSFVHDKEASEDILQGVMVKIW